MSGPAREPARWVSCIPWPARPSVTSNKTQVTIEMIGKTATPELSVVIHRHDVPARTEAVGQRRLAEEIGRREGHSNVALKGRGP